VIGVSALGNRSEKSGYSNYGVPANDVAAPGGNGTTGDCRTTILSTLPAGAYGCIQGTSMASPHATGGRGAHGEPVRQGRQVGDVQLSPTVVEQKLKQTAVDIGVKGYDTCFGNGRIDALRAVQNDTATTYDGSAPFCPE